MSTAGMPSTKLGLLMTDFDNTCNKKDTTELFYKASQTYQHANENERSVLDAKWRKIQNTYLDGYSSLIKETLGEFSHQSSEKFNKQGLLSFLKVIADFNAVATEDVDKSQIVNGVDETGLKLVARKVIFYPGCVDLLKRISQHVRIVSVNWSAEFIGYSFNSVIPQKHIHANKLLGKNGLSNGIVGKNMITSFDKRKIMQMLIATKELPGLNIFVGDSITDLLCLIDADIGIIIDDSSSLLKTASIFGIDVIPLSEHLQNMNIVKNTTTKCNKFPTLFKAASWFEIEELVNKLM